jgi:hypothetical protein
MAGRGCRAAPAAAEHTPAAELQQLHAAVDPAPTAAGTVAAAFQVRQCFITGCSTLSIFVPLCYFANVCVTARRRRTIEELEHELHAAAHLVQSIGL